MFVGVSELGSFGCSSPSLFDSDTGVYFFIYFVFLGVFFFFAPPPPPVPPTCCVCAREDRGSAALECALCLIALIAPGL